MISTALLLLLPLLAAQAGLYAAQQDPADIWHRSSLSGGFCGLCPILQDSGLELCAGVTNIYHQNVHGGLSTHRRAGRYSGSYDVELTADLERILGIRDASLYVHVEGGWPDTRGIDAGSVGSALGVNFDTIGDRNMDIVELFYEGRLFGGGLAFMAGKIDFRAVFDASQYANNETFQFLNGSLRNNSAIPFPDYSLGLVLSCDLSDWLSLTAGVADAQADGRETGFRTAFYKEDYFFYILEAQAKTNFSCQNGSLPGNIRIGLWNDPQPKANSDASKTYRDDIGFYTSCDQLVIKENSDPNDCQGLGVFARYGYANSKRNDITNFWSAGIHYQGPFTGRDCDVIALGLAKGIFSNSASTSFTEDYESVLELFYNARLTPWMNVSPSIQYITNPGGAPGLTNSFIIGLRAQIVF